jgi:hypothetical protein
MERDSSGTTRRVPLRHSSCVKCLDSSASAWLTVYLSVHKASTRYRIAGQFAARCPLLVCFTAALIIHLDQRLEKSH